jgi:hypothetical protein
MANVVEKEAGYRWKDAYVGPYWFVPDDSGRIVLMAHRCTLAEAEEYGECLTCPHGHYDVWESWRVKCPRANVVGVLRDAEYEEWPRGRVVFNALWDQFMVYADSQISKSELQRVLGYFGIARDRAVFMRDAHYQSTRLLRSTSAGSNR